MSTEVDPKARDLMKKRTSKYNKEMKDTEEKLDEESSPMDPENMESEKGLRRQSPFFKVRKENMCRPNLIPFFKKFQKYYEDFVSENNANAECVSNKLYSPDVGE